MDESAFEAALKADGFAEIEKKSVAADIVNSAHAHPFDVRLMVLEGEMTVTRDGVPHTCRPGDTFDMQAGCQHFESYGPQGSVYMVGRKRHT